MLLFLKIKIKLEKIINDFCNLFVLCTQVFYLINFVFTMGNSCYPFFWEEVAFYWLFKFKFFRYDHIFINNL